MADERLSSDLAKRSGYPAATPLGDVELGIMRGCADPHTQEHRKQFVSAKLRADWAQVLELRLDDITANDIVLLGE